MDASQNSPDILKRLIPFPTLHQPSADSMTPHSPGLLPPPLDAPPQALLWARFVFSVSVMFCLGPSSLLLDIFIYSKGTNYHLYVNDFQIFTFSPGVCFYRASGTSFMSIYSLISWVSLLSYSIDTSNSTFPELSPHL